VTLKLAQEVLGAFDGLCPLWTDSQDKLSGGARVWHQPELGGVWAATKPQEGNAIHYDKTLWRRLLADHFFRSTIAPIEADDVKRILANIDARRSNGRDSFVGHGAPFDTCPIPASLAGGAGARPNLTL
jgi:hypothetical protein